MRYHIASDHAGFRVKGSTIELLKKHGVDVVDHGPANADRCDYPDYAKLVAEAVLADAGSFGILICGSGIGMSIMANRYTGIRAALCHDAYTAFVARAHNDANILCFGERIVGEGVIESIVEAWLAGKFEGGRHCGRVEKLGSAGLS